MSALGRSRLCENSDFEVARRISVSVSSLWEPIAPATSLGRRQLRKQFCGSLAQASFHTAWVNRVILAVRPTTSSLPRLADIIRAGRHVSNVPITDVA